jgi:oligoendopeptidase F
VASTLNEGLLLQYLLKKTDDEKMRLYLLNRSVDNAWGTFVFQSLLAHFEFMIHDAVEKGSALSPETFSQLYADLVKNYSGDAYDMDEYSAIKWSRIPHFYRMFYVYQYATSFAASQAILTKFVAGEKDIVPKYLTLLSSGGNDYPIELLKRCGVDMTTSAPTEATIKLFGDQVAEMGRLVKG